MLISTTKLESFTQKHNRYLLFWASKAAEHSSLSLLIARTLLNLFLVQHVFCYCFLHIKSKQAIAKQNFLWSHCSNFSPSLEISHQVLSKSLGNIEYCFSAPWCLCPEPNIQILTLASTQPGKLPNQVIMAYQFTSHQH